MNGIFANNNGNIGKANAINLSIIFFLIINIDTSNLIISNNMNNNAIININANENINIEEENNRNNNNNNISNNHQNINNPNLNERIQDQNTSLLRRIIKNQTFIFKLFFTINLVIFIANVFFKFNLMNVSICEWPILYLKQYYRLLTHHFFHLNFIHFFFNMLIFYFIGRIMEKKIGSMLLLIIILKSIILISLIYLGIIKLLKYIVITTLKFKDYNYDFYSSVGFSGILFCIYEIFCLFSSRADNYQNVFSFLPIKSKYLPLFYLFCNQLINPNSSYIGHASGIICGWIIKEVFVYFTLPNKYNILSFEKKYEKYIDFLELKFNYVKISKITGEDNLIDLGELDKNLMDLCILKKISILIKGNKGVREINDQNILITSNDIERNVRSNNNISRNIYRLDEEI